MQYTGIILAGGKSRRMGTDKALMNYNGTLLLDKAIKLCASFCSSVLISTNNPSHHRAGHVIVKDEIKNCGPLGGIYSALKTSVNDWNFIMSVDSPNVSKELVEQLMNNLDDVDAVVPYTIQGKEPLLAMYHKKCLPVLKHSLTTGEFKMHKVLERLDVKWVNIQKLVDRFPDALDNLNSPDDM